jgi:hypothetical protein
MTFVGIVGARKFKDRKSVIDFVNGLPVDSIVVTSSCKGVCTWAGSAAKLRGLQVKLYSPNLCNTRDKFEVVQRYYQRNRQLISACDVVHAFISKEAGLTGGTKYEVKYAKSLGKMVFLHWESSIVERVYQNSLPFSSHAKELTSSWMNFFLHTLG